MHVLLAEGREELNFDKAKDTHKEVQKTILRGNQLELYADVKRLLPEHIKPECLEKQMEIEEYVRDESKRNRADGRSPTKGTKRKRNDDVLRNIPTGASAGFVSVAELVLKGAKKQKKPAVVKDLEFAGQDDDTDMELESGLVLAPPRRTKSAAAPKLKESRMKLPKASTMDGPTTQKKQKRAMASKPVSSQLSSKGVDDENNLEIERGIARSPPDHTQFGDFVISANSSPTHASPTGAIVDLSDSVSKNTSQQGKHGSLQH